MDEEKDLLQEIDIGVAEVEAKEDEAVTVNAPENAVGVSESDSEATQTETMEYIMVEEPEEMVVDVNEAFVGTNGVVMPEHTHKISEVERLSDDLIKLGLPNQLYIQGHSYAEFRRWKGRTSPYEHCYGYFVSLVNDNDNNEWIKICNATEDDVYGVIVDNSGICGKQVADYNIFDEQSPNRANDEEWAKVCLLGTVRVRFGGDSREYSVLKSGDYVVPDEQGCAKKSDNGIGFKVVGKESGGVGENAGNFVVITLVPQNDNVARVMKKLEETNKGVGDLQIQIGNLNNKVDTNISISGKFEELEDYIKGEATDSINAAKEASETAQQISNEAIEKMETMTSNYETAMNETELAKGKAQAALNEINKHQDNLDVVAQYGDKIIGFFSKESEDEVSIGTIGRAQGEVTMIKQSTDALQNLICHVDVYSVGEQSPTNGLSYEEAQGALGPYEYVYVPTKNHTEYSPIYICTSPLTQDVWYEFTIGNTYYFKPAISYTAANLQFNTKTKCLTIDNEEVDIQERAPHITPIPIPSEFISEKSITFKVRDIDEYTALGNSYVWKQIDGGFWWEVVEDSVLHYSEKEPTSDYDLWYTRNGIRDLETNEYKYNPGTLYCKTKSGWMAVATINDKNTLIMSYINKTADEISSTITNVGGQVSRISQRVDAIESSVSDSGLLSEIQQTAKNIRLGIADPGGGASELELLLSGLKSDAVYKGKTWVCDVLDTWPSSDKVYYSQEPQWNGTEFVFNEQHRTSQDVDTYCVGDQQKTYYKLFDGGYEVYTNGNTVMASINTRVDKNESAVESWTRFESEASEVMTAVKQNSNADAAELISMVTGVYTDCVETKIELTSDELTLLQELDKYSRKPVWAVKENGIKGFVFDPLYESDEGMYCTDNDQYYYALTLDGGNIVGYQKYEIKDSNYASMIQKTDDSGSFIGFEAGGKNVNGGVFIKSINDEKTEALIKADKIGINGTAVFQDRLAEGRTTISGDYIRTGVIRSNNYSGPVTYKMYGVQIQNNTICVGTTISDCIYYTFKANGTRLYDDKTTPTWLYAKSIEIDEVLITEETYNQLTDDEQKQSYQYIVTTVDFELIPNNIETLGTKFDLNNGTIYSKNLVLDRLGNLTISGQISAISGWIGDQKSNGFEIKSRENTNGDMEYYLGNGQISYDGSELLDDTNKGDEGVYIGPDGIGLGNGNFYVDNNGNIVLNGSITWGNSNGFVRVLYARSHTQGAPTDEYDDYDDEYTSSTVWHRTYDEEYDRYMSYSYDGGKTWEEPIRITGEDGASGADGSDADVTPENIFNILTDDGINQGLFPVFKDSGESQLYINAEYIKSGTLSGRKIVSATDDNDNVVSIDEGYIYLYPDGKIDDTPKLKIGCNTTTRGQVFPFMQFGEGITGTSEEEHGYPITPGTGLIYKDNNTFGISFFDSEHKSHSISFYDVMSDVGIESHIMFSGDKVSFTGCTTVDFTGCETPGIKAVFG